MELVLMEFVMCRRCTCCHGDWFCTLIPLMSHSMCWYRAISTSDVARHFYRENSGKFDEIISMHCEATSGMARLIVPTIYMFYTEEAENAVKANRRDFSHTHDSIQRYYAELVCDLSKDIIDSKESERSRECGVSWQHSFRNYRLVVCKEKEDLCVCFEAIHGVTEAQVKELIRRLRMSIWLDARGTRAVGEVMNDVFWKRAETTPRHEAWSAFSASTGEGIGEEEV